MPTYQYVSRKTGETITKQRPMVDRKRPIHENGDTFFFQAIPLFSIGGPPKHELGGPEAVLKGYYKQEQKLGARFSTEFKANDIKRAWSTPYEQ